LKNIEPSDELKELFIKFGPCGEYLAEIYRQKNILRVLENANDMWVGVKFCLFGEERNHYILTSDFINSTKERIKALVNDFIEGMDLHIETFDTED